MGHSVQVTSPAFRRVFLNALNFRRALFVALGLSLTLLPLSLLTAQEARVSQSTVEKIQLHKQGDSQVETAGIRGTLNGDHTVEYLIEAKTGQSLDLDLRSDHAQAGYRITAPAAPRALHRGQGLHSSYSVTLPRDGTYRVLVYLLDAAARKGERAEFILNIRLRNPG